MAADRAPVVAERLTKRFKDLSAVDQLDLQVPAGSIVGLIGPSGCGKTTTVRLLTGAYEPTEGRVELLGVEPRHLSTRLRRRIGYLPQLPILFPNLTLWENLNYSASLYGMGLRHRRKRIKAVLELTELQEHRRKRVDALSGGMQRRLALAATLGHEPDMLFLDEPTAGIDPILRRKFWDRFRELRDQGRTFLVTTQYVAEAIYCDKVGLMSDGRLIALDTPEGLRAQAAGGDLLEFVTARPLSQEQLAEVAALPFVRRFPSRTEGNGVQVVVDNCSAALADLVAWLHRRDVEIEASGEKPLDYDEVFVRLVERDRAARGAEGDRAA